MSRIPSRSFGDFNPCDAFDIGTEIPESRRDQAKRTAFCVGQRDSVKLVDQDSVIASLLKREAG